MRPRSLVAPVGLGVSVVCAMLLFAAGAQASFGVLPGSLSTVALNRDGTIDTQAGSHPYAYTVSFAFKLNAEGHTEGDVRDIYVELPPGLVGDPIAVPRCSSQEFEGITPACSGNSQIGIVRSIIGGIGEAVEPVYNLVTPHGVAARFGADVDHKDVAESSFVRTGSDYGVTVATNNIPIRGVESVSETIWGVPAAEGHNPERHCIVDGSGVEGCASGVVPQPFLTLPTSCDGPLQTSIRADSFAEPENLLAPETALSRDADGNPAGLSGCESLAFSPSLTAAPDTGDADSPAGLTAEVSVPPSGLTAAEGVSSADIKDTTVTLPEGLVVNPGQAAGLVACQPSEDGVGGEGPASCPKASKVGTVKITTPLLEEALEGEVFVLPSDPPHLELLVAANDPVDGIYLKLIGKVHLNEATGQLVTTFSETPPLPFTSFKLSFSGGAQAALATPARCGVYTTTSDFTPWSAPFTEDVPSSSSFAIDAGPGGGPCPSSPLPFGPSLIAGSSTDQAGGYTDFSLLLQNGESQQRIERLQFKAPEGLSGMISTVPLCGEPQAAQGTCAAASQIGHATVASGPGPYPLVIPQPGNPESPIYLTGPYEGAPFGLSIVTHVIAGPFNLGTIVTRAKIEVDPHTAQITVTTDPLPQIVAGVPTDLRLVDSVIDRPGFMFNPTNCDPSSFSGTAWGTPPPGGGGSGASAPIASRFQVGSCRGLEFHPKLSVSTSGKTSKADGAGLTTELAYPSAAQGTQADIARVKVDLPKQLPSRLTTLQKACVAKVFEADPASCPAASVIGHALVHTPLLPVPLEGPAIFVSHGGEAFPSLTMVLQGDGVTIDLVGSTFISKAGITSTTFKAVPDEPFSTFELILPQGPYSALAANGNLCAPTKTASERKRVTVRVNGRIKHVTRTVKHTVPVTLEMPTEFVAQNGAVIHQSTKIAVNGCPKAKKTKKVKKVKKAVNANARGGKHG